MLFHQEDTPIYLGPFDIDTEGGNLGWHTFWAVLSKPRPDLQLASQGGRGKLAPEPTAGPNHHRDDATDQDVSPAASSNDKTSRETRRKRSRKRCLGFRRWVDDRSEADFVMEDDGAEKTVVSNDTELIRGSKMPSRFRSTHQRATSTVQEGRRHN